MCQFQISRGQQLDGANDSSSDDDDDVDNTKDDDDDDDDDDENKEGEEEVRCLQGFHNEKRNYYVNR